MEKTGALTSHESPCEICGKKSVRIVKNAAGRAIPLCDTCELSEETIKQAAENLMKGRR